MNFEIHHKHNFGKDEIKNYRAFRELMINICFSNQMFTVQCSGGKGKKRQRLNNALTGTA
jgi:hypothetical protein